MLLFDPKSLSSWKERGIKNLSCIITNTGCAGQSIKIIEWRDPALDHTLTSGGITVSIDEKYHDLLEDARLTFVKGKWILKSNAINTRCGCGKSFSIKSGNPIQDKVARMKLAMKQKRDGVHI